MTQVIVVLGPGLVRDALAHALRREPGLDVAVLDPQGAASWVGPRPTHPEQRVVVTDAMTRASEGSVDSSVFAALGGLRTRWVVRVGPGEDVSEVVQHRPWGLWSDRSEEGGVVEAVHQVAAGFGWIAPDLVPALLEDYVRHCLRRGAARRHVGALTRRETEQLALVAAGRSNAEIAGHLHLAVPTVKDYVASLLRHLSMTRTEAIAVAVRAGIDVAGPR